MWLRVAKCRYVPLQFRQFVQSWIETRAENEPALMKKAGVDGKVLEQLSAEDLGLAHLSEKGLIDIIGSKTARLASLKSEYLLALDDFMKVRGRGRATATATATAPIANPNPKPTLSLSLP